MMILKAMDGVSLDIEKVEGPMRVGAYVRISAACTFYEDWKERRATICGVQINRWGRIDITLCEDDDLTGEIVSGFQPGDLIEIP